MSLSKISILSKDDYYNLISDLLSRDEFESKISRYKEEYSDLLIEEVLAHLIVAELGRNVNNISNLSDLKPGTRGTLFVSIIPPEPKVFSKLKTNLKGTEINVSDPTGHGRLILWDQQQVELVENKLIKIGTKLKLINAKISKSNYGIDLSLDRSESLVIDPSDFPDPDSFEINISVLDIASITDDGPVDILGTITWKNQLRTFKRKNNSTGSVLNLELFDGTGKIRLTLWDDHAKQAENFDIGDQLKILNGYSKLHNSEREIHTNYRTQIIKVTDEK
jgi:ssDNA-binding replication factor A large subunit